MDKKTLTWDDINKYRYTGHYFCKGKGHGYHSVELKNGEIISKEEWITRIQRHIELNNHQYLYNALKEYWTEHPNGNSPEYQAYSSYASKLFNNPTWTNFNDFKARGLYLEKLGDVYPWPT